jgi:2-polyprenyl-3-methyl-5-hydroxy-6-metoxy-1,4-benzoquinol methylase
VEARTVITTPAFSQKILNCLKAPGGDDRDSLELCEAGLRCITSGAVYPFINGVPSLYQPAPGEDIGVTSRVRAFYEENPFPSYEDVEEFGELVNKGYQNPFTLRLLKAIGYNKLILECGCGTGQLTHFLQLNNNHTLGIDLSLSSLALALAHKQRNQLTRSAFVQMNIFELAVQDASFDVVIAHGVLHHTFNTRLAFAQIVRKVKPGGIIMVGLYNYFARIPTWLRAKLIGILGPKIDFVVRSRIHDARKADIWIKDQYYNPHETWHSMDEVLGWFAENNVEFLNASPAILGTDGEDTANLFARTSPGNRGQRLLTQLSWLGTIAREGALFDLIGRRKD